MIMQCSLLDISRVSFDHAIKFSKLSFCREVIDLFKARNLMEVVGGLANDHSDSDSSDEGDDDIASILFSVNALFLV